MDENDNDEEIENQQPIKQEKKKTINYLFFIVLFSILDGISLILTIIFIFTSITVLLWLCLILTLIFSTLIGITIYFKIKQDNFQREEKRRQEEQIRLLEEQKKREEEEEEKRRPKEIEEQKKREEEKEKRRLKEIEEQKKKEEEKRKEEERLKEMKRKMLENQKKLRENNYNNIDNNIQDEKQVNKKINETLEDMCIYGNIIEKETKEEKEKHPEKFIETSQALQLEKEDSGIFALGLISQNLESIGVETAIEKDENEEEKDAGSACLQFITNGMCEKKKYDLHFDFGEKRNEELLDSEEEYEKFKNDLKLKLSKDYNIPMDKIIVTFPQKGSYRVQVIFQSDEFNNLDTNEFINKFKNDNEFKELSNLKEIHQDLVMKGCKLARNQLDPRGNRNDGWGVGECRGGKPYNPPIGWNGIGLKVFDKYGNNTWLGMNNSPGEWCVAYHGVGVNQAPKDVKKVTNLIYTGSFKKGSRQAHKDCNDIYHYSKKVGEGVYCTPNVSTAEGYAGISDVNGKNYKTVLMVRVKPSAIRQCTCIKDYWVVNGTTDEIRPYRILYKQV